MTLEIVGNPGNLRPLVIDDEARAKVQRVVVYARRRENFFHVYPDGTHSALIPGKDYRHVAKLSTYRCVFSFTCDHGSGKVFRHLSISVPRAGKFPHMVAAFTIAELFGFTGWDGKTWDKIPDGWLAQIAKEDNAIVLAQEEPAIKLEEATNEQTKVHPQ